MKATTDTKRAFLAAVMAGDVKVSQILAERLKAENRPVLTLRIAYKDGLYVVDGKKFDRAGLETYLSELRPKYRVKYFVICEGEGEDRPNFDFIEDYQTKELNGFVVV